MYTSALQRRRSTTTSGLGFSEVTKRTVWNKAATIPSLNSALWRLDPCGARMYWPAYGKTVERGFGWEIDHIKPVAKGGSDNFINLQALQWENNRFKSDSLTLNYCVMRYAGGA